MADARKGTTLGTLFRFATRALGLTGLVAAAVGAVLLATVMPPETWTHETFHNALHAETGSFINIAAGLLVGGLLVVAVWLMLELLSGLFLVTGRRSAVGANAYLQIALAVALVGVINAYSFDQYKRWDCTRDHQFTLPQSVIDDLSKVTAPTDIIVLQMHKTAGGDDKPDALDFAAERKVIEKVRDLVDQFRELGPRFKVSVLDVEEDGYDGKVTALTQNAPELKAAIDAAPENSILFRSGSAVRRMSFNDFLLLDKSASKSADGKTINNLVLIPQGIDRVAKRVIDLDAKTPRVGLLTIHPVLSTQGTNEWTAGGLRKTLEANGFTVKDVMVKKWGDTGGQPASATVEEYDLDDLQGTYMSLKEEVADWEAQAAGITSTMEQIKKLALPVRLELPDSIIRVETEADRKKILGRMEKLVDLAKEEMAARTKQLTEVGPKYFAAMTNDRAMEGRKVADLKGKFTADIADCDVLIIPRLTSYDVSKGGILAPSYFPLAKEHAEVVKEFLKAGKPVMVGFGPIEFGLPGGRGGGGEGDAQPDDLEQLFARLGIEFGRQTVLTDAEGQVVARQQRDRLGNTEPPPPLSFHADAKPNPISAAIALSGKATGHPMTVRVSGPRPVYLNSSAKAKLTYSGELLDSLKESWNEAKILRTASYRPKFEPTKDDDPKKGTRDEERRGPFSVGVAVEVPVPAEWLAPKVEVLQATLAAGSVSTLGAAAIDVLDPGAFANALPSTDRPPARTVRLVALGHGGVFTGKQLDAAQEKLLLHSLNWQLRRDDSLPTDPGTTWQFPRAALAERDVTLWRWGTFLGLPLLAGYLGLLALMLRKVR